MHDRNGSTSEYCFIRGQNIGMTGMVILVSTADVLTTKGAVLTSITIPVIQMFCTIMKQYSLVLPFLSYICSDH
jgi:predicted aconitase with swiveling domain